MLSENLKRLREERGFSREELEKLAGVHWRTIACIEYGKTPNPQISTIEKLAKSLNVTVEELIA